MNDNTRFKRFLAVVSALLLLIALLPSGVRATQVSTPAAEGEQVYIDPDNRFSVPIPTNWIAEEQEGYVRIATSDGKIAISVGIVDAPGATPGIAELMRLVDPEFDDAMLAKFLATPENEADDSALYTFDDGSESGRLVQGLGRKLGDEVFVLLLHGELETVQLRQVQVDKIFNGILIRTESEATPAASPAA